MSLKAKSGVLNNLIWKFSERILAQAVTTIVSIILARLLEPSHYGTIAIVNIFITIANVFVGDGIGSALVQKKDADRVDYSTLLIFNVCFSFALYALIFFTAPFIALFYGDGYEILVPVLRVLGIRVIFTGVNAIQNAYVSKKMMFQKFFLATLSGTVASAVVGIAMAYAGFGIWALVFQYLTNTTVNTLVLAFVIRKAPSLQFSFVRLKGLLNFGIKILGTNVLGTFYNQLRALIIGKVYTSSDLAYFDKGQQFPSLIINNINTSIASVLFPKMSNEQEDKQKIKQIMRRAIRLSSYIMSPLMMGLFAVSEDFVKLILTEKWIQCVPLMQLLCIYYLFWPIHSLNMQTIKALGCGNTYFKIEVIKKILDIIILLITFKISVLAMTVGMVVSSIISVFINAYPNQKLIDYSIKDQILDILPAVILSVVMAGVVLCVGYMLPLGSGSILCIQIVVGALMYALLSLLTKNDEFIYMMKCIKRKLNKEGENR